MQKFIYSRLKKVGNGKQSVHPSQNYVQMKKGRLKFPKKVSRILKPPNKMP